jgi:two-component system alkaline phosphatase synthesis response regulator PhoP
LVIDEEAYLLRNFVYLAESAGYHVTGSPDPRKGWDLAQKLHPDVILLNTIPPDGHGKQLCKQVKADPVLSGTAIIMLTGGTSGTDAQPDLPGIDIDEYVIKPVTSRDLLVRVQAILRVKQTEAQLAKALKDLQEKQSLLASTKKQLRTSQKQSRQAVSVAHNYAMPTQAIRKAVYETLPIACCTLDKYGLIVEANTLAAAQCGTQWLAFVDTLFPDYMVDDDVSKFFEHLSRVFKTRDREVCELKLKTKSKQSCVVRLESLALPKTSKKATDQCTTTLTDITSFVKKAQYERKIEELRDTQNRLQTPLESHSVPQDTYVQKIEELQRTQERLKNSLDIDRSHLQAILDNLNDGVVLCDFTGYFEIFNARMEALTGYTHAEANQHTDFQLVLYPDPKRYHQATMRIAEIMATGQPQSCITTIRTKDGTEKTLTVFTSRVECREQEWLLSTYQDITEYRQLKQKLIHSQKRRRKSIRV